MFKREKDEHKILDVNASMQGILVFKDPVNLRINGSFEGKLDTKGILNIGKDASIRADITGEKIVIDGKVTGNITAQKELKVMSTAHIVGDIITPVLTVEPGAIVHGKCQMLNGPGARDIFNVEQLAKYLELEIPNIVEWANSGKIPAFKEGNDWKFERPKIDEWVVREKIK